MNASPQRDASLQRRTHQTRETLFYLDWLHQRNTSDSTATATDLRGGSADDKLLIEYVCCVIHENIYTVCVYTWGYSPSGFSWVLFRSEAQCSCGPTAHVYLRRSSNLKDNPSFLTTSVVSSPFLFWKLHNLSFEVSVTLPAVFFVPLIQ